MTIPCPVPLVFRDSALLVVNKPSGLLVIPSPKKEKETLGTILDGWLRQESESDTVLAWPCHRIDRDTSGLMVYAFGKSLRQKVMDSFETHSVQKSYLAIANGRVGPESGSIKVPIDHKEAHSDFRVLARTTQYTVLMVQPRTGRTNQIRIHCAHMGHPLLGDAKFGVRKDFQLDFKRTALHAWRLELPHPSNDTPQRFEAPIPADMAGLINAAGLSAR